MASLPIYYSHTVRPKLSNGHTPSAPQLPLSYLMVGSLYKSCRGEPSPESVVLSLRGKLKSWRDLLWVPCLVIFFFKLGDYGLLSTPAIVCKILWVRGIYIWGERRSMYFISFSGVSITNAHHQLSKQNQRFGTIRASSVSHFSSV